MIKIIHLHGIRVIQLSCLFVYLFVFEAQTVEWGSITLVNAEKRLLANALLDVNNERFVLLSESCIPVFNFPRVYDYLIKSEQSFVQSYDEDSKQGRGRYNRRMHPTVKIEQWRKGSEWFELNRKLAVKMISDYKYYHVFRRHCKPTCYPDEHYFPTYINMFYGSLNSNRTVTWVDWSKKAPHPAMFGARNVTEDLITSIRNNGTICTYNNKTTSVCYLFARKFSPCSLQPLLRMSSAVMNY